MICRCFICEKMCIRDRFYRCYLASIVSYLVIVIISEKLSEHPQWLFAIVLLAITGIGSVSYTHLNDFIRIHQSYLVNMKHIEKVSRYEALLNNGIIWGSKPPRKKRFVPWKFHINDFKLKNGILYVLFRVSSACFQPIL